MTAARLWPWRVSLFVFVLVLGWPRTEAARTIALCTIESSGIEFGLYDPLDAAPLEATGGITYTCSTQVAVVIVMTTGDGGSFDRRMSSGSDTLSYNLYVDSARTKVWGDGTLGTATHVDLNPPKDSSVGVRVYGRVPARQDVADGRYTDNLMLVMVF